MATVDVARVPMARLTLTGSRLAAAPVRRPVDAGGRRSAASVLTATDGAGELAFFDLDRAGDEAAAFEALFPAADSAELIAPATCLAHLARIFELWERHATPEHRPQLVPRLWQAADLVSATGDNERAVALARRALELGHPPEGRGMGV